MSYYPQFDLIKGKTKISYLKICVGIFFFAFIYTALECEVFTMIFATEKYALGVGRRNTNRAIGTDRKIYIYSIYSLYV